MKQPLVFFESIGERVTGKRVSGQRIEKVFLNSKERVNNGLFIPIKGERFDGHDFIEEAIENGAIAAYWQEDKPIPEPLKNKITYIIVKNTLKALQKTAEKFLAKVQPTVIAITGSNGKTTTKDLVFSLVSRKFQTHKTEGNLNNHIGMPLTILSMDENCEALILEMGMNHFGEIAFLSRLAKPHYAIITNVGESHLEQLGTRENIAKAKLEICDGLEKDGTLFLDGDEPLLQSIDKKINVVTCGFSDASHVKIVLLSSDEKEQVFRLHDGSEIYVLPLLGKHNVKNAAYAIAVAQQLGVSEIDICQGLKRIQLTGMRLQRLRGKNGALLINDAYNASPTSMIAALQSLSMLQDYPTKVAVLGDMYELGKNEKQLHEKVAKAIDGAIDAVICIGSKGRWIGEALLAKSWKGSVYLCETKEEAVPYIESMLSDKSAILFKASRGMKLETIIENLICRQ